ncbi:MAG: phosphatase PAP2 family protein [Acetobacteraceae bacterium]|nr:phosphatase PAP2 family protein [Acetobacteraceae bacterium]
MHFLTDFADLGVLLPLTGLVALALILVGRRREALAWTLAISGTFATMLVLKLFVFVVFGSASIKGLGNPSGHTAAGIVVYAGLVALVGERFAPRVPIALLAGAVFGALFGFSRWALRYHSLADVLVGGAVGLAGVLALAWLAGPRRREAPASGLAVVAAVSLLAVLTLHGTKLHAEAALRSIAAEVRAGVSD